jgi:hypothetical protein
MTNRIFQIAFVLAVLVFGTSMASYSQQLDRLTYRSELQKGLGYNLNASLYCFTTYQAADHQMVYTGSVIVDANKHDEQVADVNSEYFPLGWFDEKHLLVKSKGKLCLLDPITNAISPFEHEKSLKEILQKYHLVIENFKFKASESGLHAYGTISSGRILHLFIEEAEIQILEHDLAFKEEEQLLSFTYDPANGKFIYITYQISMEHSGPEFPTTTVMKSYCMFNDSIETIFTFDPDEEVLNYQLAIGSDQNVFCSFESPFRSSKVISISLPDRKATNLFQSSTFRILQLHAIQQEKFSGFFTVEPLSFSGKEEIFVAVPLAD